MAHPVSAVRAYMSVTPIAKFMPSEADGSIAWNYQAIVAETENKAYQYFSTAVETDVPSLPTRTGSMWARPAATYTVSTPQMAT